MAFLFEVKCSDTTFFLIAFDMYAFSAHIYTVDMGVERDDQKEGGTDRGHIDKIDGILD